MKEVCSVIEGKSSSMYYPPHGDSSSFRHQPTPTPLNDQTTMADHSFAAQVPPPPPPSPGQFYQQPPLPPTPPIKPYSKLVLLIMACSCFFSFLLMSLGGSKDGAPTLAGNIGASLFVGVLVSVLVIDWHGFITLQAWIKWQHLSGKKRTLFICLFLFFFVVLLVIYFIRTALFLFAPSQPGLPGQQYQPPKKSRLVIGYITGACIALTGLCFTANAQPSASTSSLAQNTVIATAAVPTLQSTQPKSKPTPTPQPIPTPRPTTAPTPIPTQPPVTQTQPTQPSAPTVHTGVNGNPWGYDFSPGNYIYQPSSNFCDYFACIKSFWQNTNGYVDECNDGMYSHSGGVSGACSKHGGEMRPLYSH
jgi:hypothetical protein